MIKMSHFNVDETKGAFRISCKVTGLSEPITLYYEVTSSQDGYAPPANADWAALAIAHNAMIAGQDVEIDAPVSDSLIFALNGDLHTLLAARDPRMKNVCFSARPMVRDIPRAASAATGFSSGIDSFAALKTYTSEKTPQDMRVTHLAIFHNNVVGNRRGFDFLNKTARNYAADMGYHTASVYSNVNAIFANDSALSPGERFQATHTLRNMASASLLSPIVGTYLYASSFDYTQIKTTPTRDLGYLDPMLLPLISTDQMRYISACAGMTRIDKTLITAEEPSARTRLHVCINRPYPIPGRRINCTHCWKCARTAYQLDEIGKLDDFSEVFNVPLFRAKRDQFVKMLRNRARNGDINTLALFKWLEDNPTLAEREEALKRCA